MTITEPKSGVKWPAEDVAILRDIYPTQGIYAVLEALGHRYTKSAVKNRIHRLGLQRDPEHSIRRPWDEAEMAKLQRLKSEGMPLDEIAVTMNRSPISIYTQSSKVNGRRRWSDDEANYVREHFHSDGCKAVAMHLLGRADRVAIGQINSLAKTLGLIAMRYDPATVDQVRLLNAQGKRDREIALVIYGRDRPTERRRITMMRRRYDIPTLPVDKEKQRQCGRNTRAKQLAAGVRDPRRFSHVALAKRYGLPEDMPPRAVAIIVYLAGGPRTRPEIQAACGLTKHAIWNKRANSYTGVLIQDGWITTAKLPRAGHTGPRLMYALTAKSIECLAGAASHDG